MGRVCNPGILEHHAASRKDICQRRRGSGDLLRIRRSVRNLVQGSGRKIPGPARRHPSEDLTRKASADSGGRRCSGFSSARPEALQSVQSTRKVKAEKTLKTCLLSHPQNPIFEVRIPNSGTAANSKPGGLLVAIPTGEKFYCSGAKTLDS